CLPAAAEAGRCAIPPQPSPRWQRRSAADPRRRAPSLPRPEQSDIRPQLQPQASRSKARGVLAAATHEVGWHECRAGAPFLPPPPRAPGTPPQSAASQSTSTAVAAPDRKAPSPSSRLPINLQINEQSSHVGTRSDRWPSPDAYPPDDRAIAELQAVRAEVAALDGMPRPDSGKATGEVFEGNGLDADDRRCYA